MLHRAIATLRDTLRPHLGLSKDRVETLALIVVAMVSARTVNLSHLAAERPGSALVGFRTGRSRKLTAPGPPGGCCGVVPGGTRPERLTGYVTGGVLISRVKSTLTY